MEMNIKIVQFIENLTPESIADKRKQVLKELVSYVQESKDANGEVNLNFICTHNSRRSQFSQIWAKVLAEYYQIELKSFSGGVEVTACNERTIQSLKNTGFNVSQKGDVNPKYQVTWDSKNEGIELFSKLFNDEVNPVKNFAAVMTCSHADENCPFVTGCDVRIPVRYEDPKAFDDTPLESEMYNLRSSEIATEMKYVFSQIK